MSLILGTSSTKVMLNGCPGHRICHAKGLRQGDPLSPMLFVLVMEVFGALIRWCEAESFLNSLHCAAVCSRVSLYADDIVMFLVPADNDPVVVRTILRIFGDASGLSANMEKSVATLINCAPEDIQRITDRLECSVGAFPCWYLGIPLSIRRLRRSKGQFIIDAIAAWIPLWKGHLLNGAGRTALAQATLSAIPVHLSIVVCLSPWAIAQIDKLRRAFILCGSTSVGAGKCRVAWEITCRPKELGRAGSARPTALRHYPTSSLELVAQDGCI